jgi:thioredoxin reductase (NADPH)
MFSTADELELTPGNLTPKHKPTREELIEYYTGFARREGIRVRTGEEVIAIESRDNHLILRTNHAEHRARAVVAALGGFGRTRKLDVPGGNLPCVDYSFADAHPFSGKKVVVVGGGNSAAEAALALIEAGAQVTLAIRRSALSSPGKTGSGSPMKTWVVGPLERAVNEGRLRLISSAEVTEVKPGRIIFKRGSTKDSQTDLAVECDQVFALIGADPETRLLETAGAAIAEDGRPVYDPESYETTVPRLYVAGHLTRQKHIKNAVEVSRRVVGLIAVQLLGTPQTGSVINYAHRQRKRGC